MPRNQTDEGIMHPAQINRVNRDCAYYPCHRFLEDCTFCYCPFYPCLNENRGFYVHTKKGEKIWSCKDCAWIHKKKTVDEIFDSIRRDFKY